MRSIYVKYVIERKEKNRGEKALTFLPRSVIITLLRPNGGCNIEMSWILWEARQAPFPLSQPPKRRRCEMDMHERVAKEIINRVREADVGDIHVDRLWKEARTDIVTILRREYGTGGNSIEHQILEGIAVRCNSRATRLREMATDLDSDREHIVGNMGWDKAATAK